MYFVLWCRGHSVVIGQVEQALQGPASSSDLTHIGSLPEQDIGGQFKPSHSGSKLHKRFSNSPC